MYERVAPFVPATLSLKNAIEPWELRGARVLRRNVFSGEQQLPGFEAADAIDAVATTIVVIEEIAGMPHRVVGTVRVHAAADGLWYGSRLAIERDYRTAHGIGTRLIRRAVGIALERGCAEFRANVQQANVAFFKRLSWSALEECVLYETPHTLMQADLSAYVAYCDELAPDVVRMRLAS